MKTIQLITIVIVLTGSALSAQRPIETEKIPDLVRAQQIKDMKWGMFICWSFSTFSGTEWTRNAKSVDAFKATGLDTDQWCQTAKEAGMGYILFLAKHHDGFCLWDTKTTDWKVTRSRLGRDVLAELRKSCDKYDLKLALYFSEVDWNWLNSNKSREERIDLQKAQLEELCTNYGPIEFWWVDHAAKADEFGALSHPDFVDYVHRFQPNSFVGFNHGVPAGRLELRERGKPGPIGDMDATKYNKMTVGSYEGYLVAEFTYPILPKHEGGAQWFYSLPEHDHLVHPPEKLYQDYLGAVKYDNIFSINVGPNYEGKLRDIDVKTLTDAGEMVRAHNATQQDASLNDAERR